MLCYKALLLIPIQHSASIFLALHFPKHSVCLIKWIPPTCFFLVWLRPLNHQFSMELRLIVVLCLLFFILLFSLLSCYWTLKRGFFLVIESFCWLWRHDTDDESDLLSHVSETSSFSDDDSNVEMDAVTSQAVFDEVVWLPISYLSELELLLMLLFLQLQPVSPVEGEGLGNSASNTLLARQ